MTGLLHRLAQRAAGTAVVVRSDAALPFGAVPPAEPPPMPVPDFAPASVAEGAGVRPPAPPTPAFDANARAAAAPGTRRDEPATAMRAGAAPAGSAELPPVPLPPLVAPAPARRPAAVQTPTQAPVLDLAGGVTRPVRQADADAGPQPDAQVHGAERAGARTPPPAAGAAPAQAAHRWPAPLRPPAPLTSAAVARAAAPHTGHSPGPAAAVPAAEPAEVHIHIGRIEVTALPQAVAPRPRPAPRQPAAQPLDAYLAARSRR